MRRRPQLRRELGPAQFCRVQCSLPSLLFIAQDARRFPFPLHQVVGSGFAQMPEYERVWTRQTSSQPAHLLDFCHDVGLEPREVNLERMLDAFRRGC